MKTGITDAKIGRSMKKEDMFMFDYPQRAAAAGVAMDAGGALAGSTALPSCIVAGLIWPAFAVTFCPGMARWMPPIMTRSLASMPLRIKIGRGSCREKVCLEV